MTAETQKERYARVKAVVYDAYGKRCSCCGETNQLFLTLDHVNDDGVEHRKTVKQGTQLMYWLIRLDFPETIQLLCFNCNCGRQRNGGVCPHESTALEI